MAIKSNAFGRVTLTGKDAKKFEAQVTYGKPKQAAMASAKRGRDMAKKFAEAGGRLILR